MSGWCHPPPRLEDRFPSRKRWRANPERVVEHAVKWACFLRPLLVGRVWKHVTLTRAPTCCTESRLSWRAKRLADNAAYTGTGRRKKRLPFVLVLFLELQVIANGREAVQYFGRQQLVDNATGHLPLPIPLSALTCSQTADGGGINGRLALRLGIARALLEAGDIRHLKSNGYLTRDSCAIERKKCHPVEGSRVPKASQALRPLDPKVLKETCCISAGSFGILLNGHIFAYLRNRFSPHASRQLARSPNLSSSVVALSRARCFTSTTIIRMMTAGGLLEPDG